MSSKVIFRSFILFAFTVVLLLTVACGRKSNVRAPEDTAPGAVRFLSGSPKSDGLTLLWVTPEEIATTASLRRYDLERFAIKRSPFVAGKSPRFEIVGEVAARELKAADGSVVGGGRQVTGGLQFSFDDRDLQPGEKYEYIVVAVNARGVEGPANRVLRVTFTGESSVVENINPLQPSN